MNTQETLQSLVDDVINNEGASESLKLRAMNIVADMEKNVEEEQDEQPQITKEEILSERDPAKRMGMIRENKELFN